MLETALYDHSSFVTLTYDDENLPEGGTLVPRHMQLFLKRWRKYKHPEKVRYYYVGEYGDTTQRPHYHVALFGHRGCARGISEWRRNHTGYVCCPECNALRRIWGHGNIIVGSITQQSATYISGYVVKKWTRKDAIGLGRRHPEFARMSLKPGIGAHFMDEVASTLMSHPHFDDIEDVPAVLAHGRKKWPLGRYLRRQLRKRIGRDEKAPEATLAKMDEKMQVVRDYARRYAPKGHYNWTLKQALISASEPDRKKIEYRYRLYKQRRGI